MHESLVDFFDLMMMSVDMVWTIIVLGLGVA